jgi:hypothetical protein
MSKLLQNAFHLECFVFQGFGGKDEVRKHIHVNDFPYTFKATHTKKAKGFVYNGVNTNAVFYGAT